MIIQKPSPNKGLRGNYKPELIVIHIMAGSLSGTDNWFSSTVSQVSAHYGIGLTGEIHQYVQESEVAWANGRVNNPTAKLLKPGINPNLYTISIENEGFDLSKNPEVQLDTCANLVKEICGRYNIPIDRDHIIGHYEIFSLKPNCPATDKSVIDKIILKAKPQSKPQEEFVCIPIKKSFVDIVLNFIKTLYQ